MPAIRHTLVLLCSIVAAWAWLESPALRPYSLQAFGFAMLAYFIFKRLNNSQIWHLGPSFMSLDMAFLTFGFLLLIGATGHTSSLFFPLSFVYLFLLVFSCPVNTVMLVTAVMVLFHYIMEPSLSNTAIGQLISLPLMTFFFLFTKTQYLQAYQEQQLLETDQLYMNQCQLDSGQMQSFLNNFIRPKLFQLQKLLDFPAANHSAMLTQVTMMQVETEKLLQKVELSPAMPNLPITSPPDAPDPTNSTSASPEETPTLATTPPPSPS